MLRRFAWRAKVKYPHLQTVLLIGVGLLIGGAGGWWLSLKDWQRDELLFRAKWAMRPSEPAPEVEAASSATGRPYRHFTSCNDARLAGYGSIQSFEPSYRPELDEDGDGVACEPWPGRGRRFRF